MIKSHKNPFSRVMHQPDASTLLRHIHQVVETIGRAGCGDSLTERGSIARLGTFWQRSTMTHFHRSALPAQTLVQPKQYPFVSLNPYPFGPYPFPFPFHYM